MDDLQRAVAQFYPSASGGMFDGSCPSPAPGPIGNYEVLGASIADNDNDPNPPGSPSVSEEFGFLRMPTPEFREMVSAFDSVFDSVQEPLLSDEQRRQELSDRLTFMVENGVESTMILSLKANCLLAGSCMSGNVHVRLREKGGGQKWPCCTSLSSSMGSALFFLGEYANMILMRCGALHLTFVGLPSSGACVPAFLCNKPLRPKTSGRWSRVAFGEG
ncbi:hypothetical protein TIFTF001_046267 [Ficus carica]|uniref:Uncharacterized protein n=1 Tax=Ficus carica TaxID=3494 RepID=A0AA87ZLN1_FICCA|nr:hypothetical protein TIFTF001_046267 [Ficus carica]